jgi:hypothetical protein
VHLEKHFLSHLFRFARKRGAEDRNSQPKYLAAIPANQFGKSLRVFARLEPGDQDTVCCDVRTADFRTPPIWS